MTAGLYEQIGAELAPKIESALGVDAVRARELPQGKSVPDATTKVILRDKSGGKIGFLVCGQTLAGELVQRNVNLANEIQALLGPELGEKILAPVESGTISGITYAVYPYCVPLLSGKLKAYAQHRMLAPQLLAWLRAIAARTKVEMAPDAVEECCHAPLRKLLERSEIGGALRSEAEKVLARLDSGAWRPCHALMHCDLWTGNVLIPSRNKWNTILPIGKSFVIIDWGGASIRGFGIYDLIRLTMSMGLPASVVHEEVKAHNQILGCDPVDARSHLLMALATLGLRLEHYPVERYVKMSERCLSFLRTAEAR